MSALLMAITTFGALHAPNAKANETYGMDDLNALIKSGSWNDFFNHAKDIKPAKRDKAWQALVESGALGLMNSWVDRDYKNANLGLVKRMDGYINEFPFLKAAKSFRAKHAEVVAKSYAQCEDEPRCRGEDRVFVDSILKKIDDNADDGDLAFAMGKMLQRRHAEHLGVHPFAVALRTETRAEWCKDQALAKAIAAAKKSKLFADELKFISSVCRAK